MRIVLASHHFPPRYFGGVEAHTYRVARWLSKGGHDVRIVCVEAMDHGQRYEIQSTSDIFDDLPVQRLYFNLSLAPDPFQWSYHNPEIGEWFKAYLKQIAPDLVHINSCYLLSTSVIAAAQNLGLATVLSLHDYWFLCPHITLLRWDGTVCEDCRDRLFDCAWCLLTERRRYRWPDAISKGLFGALWRAAMRQLLSMTGKQDILLALEERRLLLQTVLERVDVVIAISQFLRERFVREGMVDPRRIRFIGTGLDLVTWKRRVKHTPSRTLRVGYLGALFEHKGVDLLLQASNRLESEGYSHQLKIYGEASDSSSYVRALKRLASRRTHIEFMGRYQNSQIERVLSGLDVVMVPSICCEVRPTVILEAFAGGTPVIAADLGGMPELVSQQVNGLLFQPGDAADLARQLQRLMDEPGLLEHLREGIKPVKTLDEEMEELLEIYRSLLPSPVVQGVSSP